MELQRLFKTTEEPRSPRPDQTHKKKSPLSIEETADQTNFKII